MRHILSVVALTLSLATPPLPALAWGDEGHEIVQCGCANLLNPDCCLWVLALSRTPRIP
jgi:hypothetical protein